MFCPQCGTNQSDELRFCKSCGANLQAVRQAVATRETDGETFDWSKTWVAEMFMSGQEALKRKAEMERLQGITPETKRYNEIKAGVILSCIGVGLAIFLIILMQGIVQGGKVPHDTAEILSRVWIAGVLPFMIGLALIFNGLFVSKKQIEAARREARAAMDELGTVEERPSLRPADTAEIIPPNFSVTEGTTKHLNVPRQES